jgi:uncharacterized protein YjaG (DUF416 family)
MNYQDFISIFKDRVYNIGYSKGLDFALKISKELLPEYVTFFQVHKWGDAEVLRNAILLCELSKVSTINKVEIEEMAAKVEEATPHMDDYGDLIASYALNACIAVYYSLQFLIDRDPLHLYNIGISYTDTVDFKVQGEDTLTEDEITAHPDMIHAWNFIIEEARSEIGFKKRDNK